MLKFLQFHRQPRAPRKRSVRSVSDHPTIVDIFHKLYGNGPCIQAISFRLTMIRYYQITTYDTRVSKRVQRTKDRNKVFAKIEARWSRIISRDLYYLRSFSICLLLQLVQYSEKFWKHSFRLTEVELTNSWLGQR